MPASFLRSRSGRATAPASSALHSRTEVCPPSAATRHWSLRLLAWLLVAEPPLAAGPRLETVRAEFAAAIADCVDDAESIGPGDVLMRINTARSLHELWHLRAALYQVIALRHSQHAAEQRLQHLARHFPTRAPGSGFMGL
jgi:hypothetical protein